MALLNESVAAGALTHIVDHDLLARVVNERHGVNVVNPVAGQHYAPDMALGETHVVNLPAAGVVTLDAPVSTDLERAWLPGAELVVVLVSPAGSTASVAWAAGYAAGGAPVPVAGSTVVGRWRNITTDASPAVWVPAAAPSGSFSGHLRASALSATDVGLVVKGFAGQAADLQEWQNSAGTVVANIDAVGDFFGQAISGVSVKASSQIRGQYEVVAGDAVWGGGTFAPAALSVASWAATEPGAIIRGFAGQTADLTQWQNSAGSIQSRIDAGGNLGVGIAPQVLGVSGKQGFFGSVLNDVQLRVRGAAGQTVDLMRWEDSTTAGVASVRSDGIFKVPYVTDPGDTGPLIRFQATSMSVLPRNPTISLPNGLFSIDNSGGNPANRAMTVFGAGFQTADLQQWLNSAAGLLAKVRYDGLLGVPFVSNTADTGPYFGFNSSSVSLTARGGVSGTPLLLIDNNVGSGGNTGSVVQVIRGAAGQVADLFQWQNSAATVMAKVDNNGRFTSAAGAFGGASVGASYLNVANSPSDTTSPTFIVQAAPSQTSEMTRWINSGGAVLATVSAAGAMSASGGVTAGSANFVGVTYNGFSNPTGVTTIPTLVSKGVTSQSADLQQWQSNSGTALSGITSVGNLYTPAIGDPAGTGPYVTMGGSSITIGTRLAGNVGLVVQGFTSQTADLQRWQDSTGSTMAKVGGGGAIQVDASRAALTVTPAMATYGLVAFHVGPPAANYVGAVVRGFASQTADLTQWQNSGATVVAKVDANGVVTGRQVNAGGVAPGDLPILVKGAASQTADLQQWQSSAGAAFLRVTGFGSLYVRANAAQGVDAAADVHINSGGTTDKPLVVRGFAAQSGRLQEWQNSAGTVLLMARADGLLGDDAGGNYMNAPTGASFRTAIRGTSGQVGLSVDAATGSDIAQFYASGVEKSWITTAGSYTASSQELKHRVARLERDRGIEALRRLEPVSFEWRDGTPGRHLGFIAEQVEAVLPEAVGFASNGGRYLGVNHAAFMPVLVSALRDVDERLATVERQLAA